MKTRHAAALALLMLASCAPDMVTINNANERAERAAKRAQAAQLQAERSAELAADAVKRTKAADYTEFENGGGAYGKGSSKWWAIKAEQAAEGMCTFRMPAVGRLPNGEMYPSYLFPGSPYYLRYQSRVKACAER